MTVIRILLLLCCLGCTFQPSAQQLRGKVVSVADGDTFTLLTRDNKQIKIRLHGVDCPEKKQDFGARAQQFTSSMVFGKEVAVEVKKKDRYGRSTALVYLADGKMLNEELLREGYAWHYKTYDKNPAWAALEAEARKDKRGLWAAKRPVAPWTYRKNRKKKPSESKPANKKAAWLWSRLNSGWILRNTSGVYPYSLL